MEENKERDIKYELTKRTMDLNPDTVDYHLSKLVLVKLFEREEMYKKITEDFSSKVKEEMLYNKANEKRKDIFDASVHTYNQLLRHKEFYEEYFSSLKNSQVDLTGLEKKLSLPEESQTNMDNNYKSCGRRGMESMN